MVTENKPQLSSNDVENIIRQASKEEDEILPVIPQEARISSGWLPTEDGDGKERIRRDPNPLGKRHRYGATKYFRLDSED